MAIFSNTAEIATEGIYLGTGSQAQLHLLRSIIDYHLPLLFTASFLWTAEAAMFSVRWPL